MTHATKCYKCTVTFRNVLTENHTSPSVPGTAASTWGLASWHHWQEVWPPNNHFRSLSDFLYLLPIYFFVLVIGITTCWVSNLISIAELGYMLMSDTCQRLWQSEAVSVFSRATELPLWEDFFEGIRQLKMFLYWQKIQEGLKTHNFITLPFTFALFSQPLLSDSFCLLLDHRTSPQDVFRLQNAWKWHSFLLISLIGL